MTPCNQLDSPTQVKNDNFPPDNVAVAQPKNLGQDSSALYISSPAEMACAFREISQLTSNLRLPTDVYDIAKQVYKTIAKDGLVPAHKMTKPFAGVCVFLACRSTGFDCPLVRIQKAMGVKRRVMGECYRVLEAKFNPDSCGEGTIVRWAGELGLPSALEDACQFVVGAISQHNIGQGRMKPGPTAAGALYFTCHVFGRGIPASDVLRISGVGLGALRAAYKRLYENKHKLVRPEWIMDGMADLDYLPFAPF